MELIVEIAVAFFLVVSGIFGFTGSYGLIKLGDPMSRLHAPTKATTLGVGGLLIAAMVSIYVFHDHLSLHELLITLFLFLAAPVTAHFIAKSHIHRHEGTDDLPDPGDDPDWAVLHHDPEDVHRPTHPPRD